MTNIIQFPRTESQQVKDMLGEKRLPQTEEETIKAITINRMMLVDEVVNSEFSRLATKMMMQGFPVEDSKFFKDYILVGEMMRAVLYKSVDIEHPLYDIITNNRDRLKKMIENGDIVFEEEYEDEDEDEE
jgi:hypothetical protein